MNELEVATTPTEVDYVAVLSAVTQEALVVLEPIVDAEGRDDFLARWVNQACADFLGTPLEQLVGTRYRDWFPEIGSLFQLLTTTLADGVARQGWLDLDRDDTPIRRIEYRVARAGCHLALSVVDRSDARAASDLAARLEVMHRAGARFSVAAAAIFRPIFADDGRIVDLVFDYVNDRSARYLGRPDETITGQLLTTVIPDGADAFVVYAEECWRRQDAIAFDLDVSGAPLAAEWLRFHLVPLADSIVAHAIDISGARLEELALRSSEQRYRSLFETANEGIALVDRAGRFQLVNATFGELLGLDHETLTGRSLLEFLAPDEVGQVIAEAEDATRTGIATPRRRVRMLRDDGTAWWGFAATSLVHDAKGNHIGFEVMVLDIDAETELELALRESENRYRAVVDNAPVIITMTDVEGRTVFANLEAERVLERSAASLIGRQSSELWAPEDITLLTEDFRALASGELDVQRRRFTLIRPSGVRMPCFGAAVALRTDGRFDGLVVVAADITAVVEREHARRELAAALAVAEQSERTQLAADLHDGPVQRLTALSMRLGAEQRRSSIDDALLAAAEETVRSTITELRTLMFQLTPPDLGGHDVGFVLADRARKLLGPSCTVELDDRWGGAPDPTTSHVLFRIAHEAIVNVAKHARATEVRLSLTETVTDYLVEIVDNGVGGDVADFFAKSPEHLGVRGMIDRTRQMGGRCDIESVPGQGTTVFVRLPRDLTNV